MKLLFKIIFYPLFFLYMLLLFLPKSEIYYFVLEKLAKENIYVKNEDIKEKLFGIEFSNAIIEYNTIDIAKVKKSSIYTCFFDTQITIDHIQIDKTLEQFVPSQIDNIFIRYSVLNPLFVTLKGDGKEFNIDGKLDLMNQVLRLELKASKSFKSIYPMVLKQFKKSKEGGYYIEYKF